MTETTSPPASEAQEIRRCGIFILNLLATTKGKGCEQSFLKSQCTSEESGISHIIFHKTQHYLEENRLIDKIKSRYIITAFGKEQLELALQQENYDFTKRSVPPASLVSAPTISNPPLRTKRPSAQQLVTGIFASTSSREEDLVAREQAEREYASSPELHKTAAENLQTAKDKLCTSRVSSLSGGKNDYTSLQLKILHELRSRGNSMSLGELIELFASAVVLQDDSGTLTIQPKTEKHLHIAIENMERFVGYDTMLDGFVTIDDANICTITESGISVLEERQARYNNSEIGENKLYHVLAHQESESSIANAEGAISPYEWKDLAHKENIHTLNISASPIKDAQLLSIIESLPNLRELNIKNCPNISDDVLEAIMDSRTKLRIEVAECPQLKTADAANERTADLLRIRKERLESLKAKYITEPATTFADRAADKNGNITPSVS